ncbi:hypothetical protein HG535_0B04530 [Zygotorulaspora mrakii]|uniref:proline--tRNA ligase n=1 Tax=Zygotorulaspora mrakii TaxID=42260 RepID=A0A7H9AYN0_ZYGMR|nr:uncharacterized protein HG535_0B04530 [Zygotorulaspora mrakii]QLG71411.1 hypothetical protein HG535_0B04530 [Zygotorulaspora mrakii]
MFKISIIRRSYHLFQPNALTKETLKSHPTHDLLQTLGFVRQSQSGLVQWLPLGLRSLRKVEDIIRYRMNTDGDALEVSLSSLSPKLLWEQTGRWSNKELFKLKDAKKAEHCLTATCEEDITSLMGNFITSHKDMPVLVYQISRKYRDELRPRGGLLRGREFLMKDAYSFVSSKEEAIKMFERVNDVYDKIFGDLRIPFVSAWADSGSIGGDLSKEYHYMHESGEDTLLKCSNCGAISNVEKAESYPIKEGEYFGDVSVKYSLSADRKTLLCFYYPRNRELNWNLALEAVDHDMDSVFNMKRNEEILQIFKQENEDIMLTRVLRIMDCRLNSRSNFPDFPLNQYLKNNFGQIDDVSIVQAQENEICGSCHEGHLSGMKTIEVGHTFYLGTKYSEPLHATFVGKDNQRGIPIEMGCYGIGVSRLIGAIGELTRDDNGFKWPTSVAPYLLSLCISPHMKNEQEIISLLQCQFKGTNLSGEIMHSFSKKLGLGARIRLSHAIGIPLCLIVGPKNWPLVEIELRGALIGTDWEKEFLDLKEKYRWEIVKSTSGYVEKHIVPVEYAKDVVKILLKYLS